MPLNHSQPLAILNGFGRVIGDGIIGLQALRTALDLGVIKGKPRAWSI